MEFTLPSSRPLRDTIPTNKQSYLQKTLPRPMSTTTIGQQKTLIYTFYRWQCSTYKALRQAELTYSKPYYIRGLSGARRLMAHLRSHAYTNVIGIADYRKNARRIRIEGKFVNRFGKGMIDEAGSAEYFPSRELPIPDDITDKEGRLVESYVATSCHNGSCNRSAYLIAQMIEEEKLPTKLSFVHIPRSIPVAQIKRLLEYWDRELN